MSQVFISYKREDELRVGRIARALEKAGFDVWWDRGLPGGESWRDNIEKALTGARCVIVVWSRASVAPEGHFVRDEAGAGMAKGLLVPVLIDPVSPPLGFGEVQAIDLSRWNGAVGDPYFQDLAAAVRAKIDGTPVPKAKGQTARLARQLLYGGASSASVAALAALAFNTFGVAGKICTLSALQPALSDSCGAVHIGGRPSREERLAWAAKPAGSCEALRDHVARFPQGAYRREAADLLTARKISYRDAWTPSTRPLAMFTPAAGPAAPGEAAAKARALDRAKADAERLCRGFGSGSLFRFISATPQAENWSCMTSGAGTVCGFDGHADCVVEEHRQVEQEICGPRAG